jgi:4-amino-4-deoxy-L-arabinose transferase-like glycosyltransferase
LPRIEWIVFAFFCVFYLLTTCGRIQQRDEETMYRVTRNLVEQGAWSVETETVTLEPVDLPGTLPTQPLAFQSTFASPGRDGQTYSKYGLGQSLTIVPLYLLGKALAALLPVPGFQYGAKLLVSFFNSIVTAATCALLLAWVQALGYSARTGLAIAVVYGLSTMAWVYTKTFYAQPATTLCLLGAAYSLTRFRQRSDRRWLGLAGASLGVAIVFRPTALIALPAFTLVLVLCRREASRARHLLLDGMVFLAPLALALGINAWYNLVRFRSLLGSGYVEATWDVPFLYGLYGMLFSPGKSVFLYNPIILLALAGVPLLARRHRDETLLISLLTVSYLAFYASYSFWTGGWNWGPRFLLPLLPLLTLSTAPLLEDSPVRGGRIAFAALAIVGLAIQLPAILVDHSRHLVALSERYPEDYYERCVRELQFSPVVNQWPVVLEVARLWSQPETWQEMQAVLTQPYSALRSGSLTLNQESNILLQQAERLRLNAPDFWWLHLYLLGWPLPAALAVPFLLAATAVMVGFIVKEVIRLHRESETGDSPA